MALRQRHLRKEFDFRQEKTVKVYEVGDVEPNNSRGNSDNKVYKLASAVELLTK